MRTPINILIVNMALSDLLYPIFLFPKIFVELNTAGHWLVGGPLGHTACKLSLFTGDVSTLVSVQSLLLIAVDRFGAVVFPLRSPLISSKQCRYFILVIWIIAMAVHCPYLIALKVVEYPEGLFCGWQWNDTFGESLSQQTYILGLIVVTNYIPLVLISILYFAIALRIKSQKIPGEQSANARERRLKKERNVLNMSVAIVLVFAVCSLPLSIYALLSLYSSNIAIWSSCSMQYFGTIAFLLACSYCAVNPCICFIFSGNYRQGLKNLFAEVNQKGNTSKNVLSAQGVYSKKYGDPCFTHMPDVDLTTNLNENSLSAESCNPFLVDYADVLKLTFITEKKNFKKLRTRFFQALKRFYFLFRVSRGLRNNECNSAVSIQSLVLISVDRFVAVVFPLRSPLFSSKLYRFFILATWIIAMATFIPYLVAFKLVEYDHEYKCVRQWMRVFDDSSSVTKYFMALLLHFFYIPFVLMFILYLAIFLKLKSQRGPGEHSMNAQIQRLRRERNALKLSIAIVLGFAVCWIPFSIFALVQHVAPLLSRTDSAMNPCICFIFSGNYRQGLNNLLGC
ncbi:unnamed protein product [Pocillopora meandrina]|uniref:G-protein coupled receptors family 1 profile domain-containing protein n=1 Tax=Pocillopora meandrina TaxID=46732 RepID=A0AAU9WV30_9CNID|nr:unnamed protein product [Pocillopora meandrina]